MINFNFNFFKKMQFSDPRFDYLMRTSIEELEYYVRYYKKIKEIETYKHYQELLKDKKNLEKEIKTAFLHPKYLNPIVRMRTFAEDEKERMDEPDYQII
jgi:hypothetical protein